MSMHPTNGMYGISSGTCGHNSGLNKPLLADSPTDSVAKNVLCKTSSLDNGLDLLIGIDSVSMSGSLEGSDTTTPSSPPSIVCYPNSNNNTNNNGNNINNNNNIIINNNYSNCDGGGGSNNQFDKGANNFNSYYVFKNGCYATAFVDKNNANAFCILPSLVGKMIRAYTYLFSSTKYI